MKTIINTENAPKAIGTYSQAVMVDNMLFISGQLPLDPKTMQFPSNEIEDNIHQVFKNLDAIVKEAGGTLNNIVKLTVLLSDLDNFAKVNEIMVKYFDAPYPARAAYAVKELPRGAVIEIEAIAVFNLD